MKKSVQYFILLAASLALFTISSCREKTTGEKIEDGIEEVGEGLEEGVEEIVDEVDDATDNK